MKTLFTLFIITTIVVFASIFLLTPAAFPMDTASVFIILIANAIFSAATYTIGATVKFFYNKYKATEQ